MLSSGEGDLLELESERFRLLLAEDFLLDLLLLSCRDVFSSARSLSRLLLDLLSSSLTELLSLSFSLTLSLSFSLSFPFCFSFFFSTSFFFLLSFSLLWLLSFLLSLSLLVVLCLLLLRLRLRLRRLSLLELRLAALAFSLDLLLRPLLDRRWREWLRLRLRLRFRCRAELLSLLLRLLSLLPRSEWLCLRLLREVDRLRLLFLRGEEEEREEEREDEDMDEEEDWLEEEEELERDDLLWRSFGEPLALFSSLRPTRSFPDTDFLTSLTSTSLRDLRRSATDSTSLSLTSGLCLGSN